MMDIHVEHNHSRMSEKLLDTFYKVETTHWWWRGRRDIIKELLTKSTHKKRVILDAGCGTGSNIMFLSQYGKTYGVDVSPVATGFCKKRGIKNVSTSDISKLPFKNNYFDIVSCMDVLEHIENDKKAIDEIYRVVKPGGKIILTVPALPFIFSEHDKAQGHFRRYNRKQMRKLLTTAGFHELKITYFNFLLCLPIVVIRLLSKFKPFSKAAHFDSKYNYEIYKERTVNEFLYAIFSKEAKVLRFVDLPFGVSILAYCRKPRSRSMRATSSKAQGTVTQ